MTRCFASVSACVCVCAHTCMRAHTHTHMHTRTRTTHTHTHTHTHTRTHARTHARTHTHTHTHARAHARTRARTHARDATLRTHARTCTDPQRHGDSLSLSLSLSLPLSHLYLYQTESNRSSCCKVRSACGVSTIVPLSSAINDIPYSDNRSNPRQTLLDHTQRLSKLTDSNTRVSSTTLRKERMLSKHFSCERGL